MADITRANTTNTVLVVIHQKFLHLTTEKQQIQTYSLTTIST